MTMVSGYSRWSAGLLIPSREAEDLYAGWWQLLEQLGSVPKLLVWDGEGAVGRWRARQSELTGDFQAFRGVFGTSVDICKPADPEAKGMVERLHDYLEKSFLPGRSANDATSAQRIMAGMTETERTVMSQPGGPARCREAHESGRFLVRRSQDDTCVGPPRLNGRAQPGQ